MSFYDLPEIRAIHGRDVRPHNPAHCDPSALTNLFCSAFCLVVTDIPHSNRKSFSR